LVLFLIIKPPGEKPGRRGQLADPPYKTPIYSF
jgi:hypothetical protein